MLDDFSIKVWAKVEDIMAAEWLKYTRSLEITVEVKAIIITPFFKRPRESPSASDTVNSVNSTPNSP
jgi:hypothetical protein